MASTAAGDVPQRSGPSLRARLRQSYARWAIYVGLLWRTRPLWASLALVLNLVNVAVSTLLLVAIGVLANSLVAAIEAGLGSSPETTVAVSASTPKQAPV